MFYSSFTEGHPATERLNNLAKDTQLASGRAWAQTEVCGMPIAVITLDFRILCVLGQGGVNKEILKTRWNKWGGVQGPQALRRGLAQLGGLGKISQRSWHLQGGLRGR